MTVAEINAQIEYQRNEMQSLSEQYYDINEPEGYTQSYLPLLSSPSILGQKYRKARRIHYRLYKTLDLYEEATMQEMLAHLDALYNPPLPAPPPEPVPEMVVTEPQPVYPIDQPGAKYTDPVSGGLTTDKKYK